MSRCTGFIATFRSCHTACARCIRRCLIILSFGYLFALIYLFHTYSAKDGDAGSLSYEDLVIAYTGSGEASRLESALRGPMSTMLPADELTTVIEWVQKGANRDGYEAVIRPILDERCMSCHDGSNPHLVNLGGYDDLKKVTEQDTGADIFTLVRVSHIHLFGISFIFFILGLIFSHAYVRPVWFKCLVITLPFVAVDDGCQFLVFHQAVSPIRLGGDVRWRDHGPVFRVHVGGVDVSAVGVSETRQGCPEGEHRPARRRLKLSRD